MDEVDKHCLSCFFGLVVARLRERRGRWLYTLLCHALVIADDLETPINEARKPELVSAFILCLFFN